MRFEAIAEVFGADASALSFVCSPYQKIASCMRRYKTPPFSPEDLVAPWVFKARRIRAFREAYPHFPRLTYQGFTAHPQCVNDMLDLDVVETELVGKKGSDALGIVDQSAAAILFMTDAEIDQVSRGLSAHADLMAYFGFEILSGQDLRAHCAQDPSALALADTRRKAWEAGRTANNLLGRMWYEMRVRLKR